MNIIMISMIILFTLLLMPIPRINLREQPTIWLIQIILIFLNSCRRRRTDNTMRILFILW